MFLKTIKKYRTKESENMERNEFSKPESLVFKNEYDYGIEEIIGCTNNAFSNRNGFYGVCIDEMSEICEDYLNWKENNNNACLPKEICNKMVCFCLGYKWDGLSDCLVDYKGRIIAIKTSTKFNTDLTSINVYDCFDNVVFIRFKPDDDIFYLYELDLNSEKLKMIFELSEDTNVQLSMIDIYIKPKHLYPDIIFDIKRCRIIEDNRKKNHDKRLELES